MRFAGNTVRNWAQFVLGIGAVVVLGVILTETGPDAWEIGLLLAFVALVFVFLEAVFWRPSSPPRVAAWAVVALGGIMMREDWADLGWSLPFAVVALCLGLLGARVLGRGALEGAGRDPKSSRSENARRSGSTRRRPQRRETPPDSRLGKDDRP